MKNIITLALVSFFPYPGEFDQNLIRVKEYIRAAAKKGADLILFPHVSLSGPPCGALPMPEERTLTLAAQQIAATTKTLAVYAIFGAIADGKPPQNVAVVCASDGQASILAANEPAALTIQTPWGAMRLAFDEDFSRRTIPEDGSRLLLHLAAQGKPRFQAMQTLAAHHGVYLASSFPACDGAVPHKGASFCIGPVPNKKGTAIHLGQPPEANVCQAPTMCVGTIDLSEAVCPSGAGSEKQEL